MNAPLTGTGDATELEVPNISSTQSEVPELTPWTLLLLSLERLSSVPRCRQVIGFGQLCGWCQSKLQNKCKDKIWASQIYIFRHSVYGQWPASGEIDVMEMRGNRNLFAEGIYNVGSEQAASTLHFGPSTSVKNHWPMTHFSKNQQPGFNENFHLYKVSWSPTQLIFYVDNVVMATVNAGSGFWNYGGFGSSGLPNPWAGATVMAPFDQEFFIIMNLAIGGTNFFDDSFTNRYTPKPWWDKLQMFLADDLQSFKQVEHVALCCQRLLERSRWMGADMESLQRRRAYASRLRSRLGFVKYLLVIKTEAEKLPTGRRSVLEKHFVSSRHPRFIMNAVFGKSKIAPFIETANAQFFSASSKFNVLSSNVCYTFYLDRFRRLFNTTVERKNC